jgi:hypothetical protein
VTKKGSVGERYGGAQLCTLTSRHHLGTLAEAVVIVCITGAEVGVLQGQAGLTPS